MTVSSLAADHSSPLGASSFTVLPSPAETAAELPAAPGAIAAVERGRAAIRAILNGLDDRLLVIAGPCSIHDAEAGLDYAARLAKAARRYSSELLVVMRTYFEKPRTTVGWKGLINDPHLDGSHDVAAGLRTARRFLLDVTALGLPVATEFLEPVSAPYLSDLVSWGAVGARTTEIQIHRQLAAGLPLPVGFKNGTDGGIQVAIDACQAAAAEQAYMGMDDGGRAALVSAPGNPDTHLILRGGSEGPNYAASSVLAASRELAAAAMNPRVIVDASHANSGKSHHRQAEVALELAAQVEAAEPASRALAGVMLESFLAGGAQKLDVAAVAAGDAELVYGQSVTDACMGWETTELVLEQLAAASGRSRGAAG